MNMWKRGQPFHTMVEYGEWNVERMWKTNIFEKRLYNKEYNK